MAGVFTRQNADKLTAAIGREPSEGELYIAHFLGANGAGKLIDAARANPAGSAASLFPDPARANPGIFYDRQGRERSVSQVYSLLVGKYRAARADEAPPTPPAVVPSNGPVETAAVPAAEPPVPNAYVAAIVGPTHIAAGDGPIFHSLFQTGERREPIAPLVTQLWAPPASPPSEAVGKNNGAASGPSEPRSGVRGLFGVRD